MDERYNWWLVSPLNAPEATQATLLSRCISSKKLVGFKFKSVPFQISKLLYRSWGLLLALSSLRACESVANTVYHIKPLIE
jgi:hypothetical protein